MRSSRELPAIIKEVGFNFNWDERKVWKLDMPIVEMPIKELTWHFAIPFFWSRPNGYYDVTPHEVMEQPELYIDEYKRTTQADTSYPIDIMYWKKRWLILDGLHRLMKQAIQGATIVQVRKISKSAIPHIRKE